MRTTIINQDPARGGRLRDTLSEVIRDEGLRDVRIMSAYVSSSGLGELEPILDELNNRGGKALAIVGFDREQTTRETLELAVTMFPTGSLKIRGADNSLFHPKVYLFSGSNRLVAVVGSSNLTGGGLLNNWEVCVAHFLEAPQDQEAIDLFESLWESHWEYEEPLQQVLDGSWIAAHESLFRQIKGVQDTRRTIGQSAKSIPMPFGKVNWVAAKAATKAKRKLGRATTKAVKGSAAATESLPRTLIMQVLGEPGGGTQIQIPTAVLGEYFGVDKSTPHPITLRLGDADHRATIRHFSDSKTHRIHMSFLTENERPLILMLRRVPRNRDIYEVAIYENGSSDYQKYLAECGRQTRKGARRYGLKTL